MPSHISILYIKMLIRMDFYIKNTTEDEFYQDKASSCDIYRRLQLSLNGPIRNVIKSDVKLYLIDINFVGSM